MEYYIDYLDAKQNFCETRKYFKTYKAAFDFMVDTFDKVDIDMIILT